MNNDHVLKSINPVKIILCAKFLYGKKTLKGSGNEDTLASVVSHNPMVSFHARDLTRGLLVKEPEDCLETFKGVIDMKKPSFFEGLNWALIHGAIHLELPNFCDAGTGSTAISLQKKSQNNTITTNTNYNYF